jgi:hypothetical protein
LRVVFTGYFIDILTFPDFGFYFDDYSAIDNITIIIDLDFLIKQWLERLTTKRAGINLLIDIIGYSECVVKNIT